MGTVKYALDGTAPEGQFSKAHVSDAGYDIKAAMDVQIPVGGEALVPTGLYVEIPVGYVGIIKSRSGLASRHGVEAGAGVIDSGYRGEVRVLLHNMISQVPFAVSRGDRVAQLCILKLYDGEVEHLPSLDEDTDRGQSGFGSTGR